MQARWSCLPSLFSHALLLVFCSAVLLLYTDSASFCGQLFLCWSLSGDRGLVLLHLHLVFSLSFILEDDEKKKCFCLPIKRSNLRIGYKVWNCLTCLELYILMLSILSRELCIFTDKITKFAVSLYFTKERKDNLFAELHTIFLCLYLM